MVEKFFKLDKLARMVLSDNQLREYYDTDRLLFENEMKNFSTINTTKFNDQLQIIDSDRPKNDLKSENQKLK